MRAISTALAAIVAFMTLASAALAAGQALSVRLDHSMRISLRAPAHDVVVGNPLIADVAVLDARHLLIIGKGYGSTNLVVTDELGRTILSTEIVVAPTDDNTVSFYRGRSVTSFACAPRCEASQPAAGAPTPAPAPVP